MKEDYLKECLSEVTSKLKKVVPMDDFQREFCVYCQNKECARSGASNMSFDRRAANWYRDLFQNIPRASENNENTLKVAKIWESSMEFVGKPKVHVKVQDEPEIKQELKSEPKQEPIQEPETLQEPESVQINQEPIEIPEQTKIPEPVKITEQIPTLLTVSKPIQSPIIRNTPFDKPEYIGEEPKEKIIQVGGTYTFEDE